MLNLEKPPAAYSKSCVLNAQSRNTPPKKITPNFHPHKVGFLLIDYKGGGMANLFAKLPHLLGTITNLDKGELLNKDLSKPTESNQIKATQLDVVVDHIAEVYKEEQHILVKKPWIPSLTSPMASPHTRQVLDSATFEKGDYQLGIGIINIPEEQTQEEYVLDLVKNGHLLYMASSLICKLLDIIYYLSVTFLSRSEKRLILICKNDKIVGNST